MFASGGSQRSSRRSSKGEVLRYKSNGKRRGYIDARRARVKQEFVCTREGKAGSSPPFAEGAAGLGMT